VDQIASLESDETFLLQKSLQYKKISDKNETETSGLTTGEAKELELDEQQSLLDAIQVIIVPHVL